MGRHGPSGWVGMDSPSLTVVGGVGKRATEKGTGTFPIDKHPLPCHTPPHATPIPSLSRRNLLPRAKKRGRARFLSTNIPSPAILPPCHAWPEPLSAESATRHQSR